jgi:spermidine synthase
MTRKRHKRRGPKDPPPAPVAAQAPDVDRLVLIGVVCCFVLSGFAALVYQTAWMRQFALLFGTSELAVATVLSAYMAGLALGAAVAGRRIEHIKRPILVYGLLEAGVAVSASAVPLILSLAGTLYVAVMGGQPNPADASGLGQPAWYLCVTFVALAIPTSCMGATLPILTKYAVHSTQQIGPRVGLLYAMNTVGAVGGTLAAGFLLLPALGLSGTVWIAIAVNGLIFVIASSIARRAGSAVTRETSVAAANPSVVHEHRMTDVWILPLMLISGANTFAYEVLWTRLLGHVLGGSIVSFATMLASFLSGIALGSAVAARIAKNRERATVGFILAQVGIAVTSIVIYRTLHSVVPDTAGLRANVGLAVAILLPATLFIGATFPFAVRILTRDAAQAGPGSARVYAWNTVGAIVGAIVAGYFLIPALKYEGAIQIAVFTSMALALVASLVVSRRHIALAATITAIAVMLLLTYRPQRPEEILRASPLTDVRDGAMRYYEVGRSATVVMLESDGFFNLRTNGLPEASTNLRGAPPYEHNQRLLSLLPVLARPDIKDMLVVGFGAGVALEGIPKSVKSIDVIELEPRVIDANRSIGSERQLDPLQDPRIHIFINDARSALELTSKRYDAIISQPSHPWTAGASHLYTREFMELARKHLKPGGVFLQWMNTEFVTKSLLKSLCATILDVYPHARAYQWNPEILFFLGSDEPLDVEREVAATGRPIKDDPTLYFEEGIGSVEDLLVALVMDEPNLRSFSRGAPVLTDDLNRMATDSAMAMENGTTLKFPEFVDLTLPFNPLLQENSWVYRDFPTSINFAYVAGRLERMGMKKNAVELSNTLERLGNNQSLLLIGLGLQRQGETQESQKVLMSALLEDPSNSQIQYAVLEPWINRIGRQTVPEYVTEVANHAAPAIHTLLTARQAAADRNWREVVALDDDLGKTRTTDLWYLDTVKLRADWRMKVTTPGYQPRLALEAERLIDNAIAIQDDPDFYSMRLGAAFVADRALDVVETARRLIYIFDRELDNAEKGRVEVNRGAIELKLSQVEAAREVVKEIETSHPDVPKYKTELLAKRLTRVVGRLTALREKNL